MVELRKRPAPEGTAPPRAKKAIPVKPSTSSKKGDSINGAASASKVAAGDSITLEGFGGEIETNDGEKTTLKKLLDESKNGVVLFTYPKASTPGLVDFLHFRVAILYFPIPYSARTHFMRVLSTLRY